MNIKDSERTYWLVHHADGREEELFFSLEAIKLAYQADLREGISEINKPDFCIYLYDK